MEENNKNLNDEQEVIINNNANESVPNDSKKESKGLSIAAMVLGIISIVLYCFVPISFPCAILAIIFGIIGRKKDGRGMATAGLVLGIIYISFFVLIILVSTGTLVSNFRYAI